MTANRPPSQPTSPDERLSRCWENLRAGFRLLNDALLLFHETKEELMELKALAAAQKSAPQPGTPVASAPCPAATPPLSMEPAEDARPGAALPKAPLPAKEVKVKEASVGKTPAQPLHEVKTIKTREGGAPKWPRYDDEEQAGRKGKMATSEWPHGERLVHHAKPGRY